MKNKLLFICFSFFTGFFSYSSEKIALPDSLVSIENVYVYCLSEPDKAQQIIDKLRELNDEKLALQFEIDWAQGDLYFNTAKYRLASYYFEQVLEYEEVKSNRKFMMGLLSTMLECYRLNNNLEKTMDTAIKLLEITETDDIKEETGRAYQYMGEVFYARKDKQNASKYFEQAENHLVESGNIPYLYHFYMTYANILAKDKQNFEALEIARKAELILHEVAEDPLMMPEGYDDYEKKRFSAFIADILAKNGKMKEAATYYKKFLANEMDQFPENKIMIVPYLLTVKKYNDVIQIANEREIKLRQHTDTVGDDMLTVKRYLAIAYDALDLKSNAIDKLREQVSIEEQLRSRQLTSMAQELAVIYETQKKDEALKEKEAEAELHKLLFIFCLGTVFLTLIIMLLVIRNQRRVKKQNKLMVEQIKEVQAYKNRQQTESQIREETDAFVILTKLMEEEYLYRNPSCCREMLMEKLGIDKNSLLKSLHSNNIDSLPNYINGYRLHEAIGLMENQRDLTMEQIAKQVGFGSLRSFQRQFKDKYDMSPVEYKRLSQ